MKQEENILVYTDGSKDETEKTGYGVHFQNIDIEDIKQPMNSWNTVFQAETVALLKATESVLNYPQIRLPGKPIVFYSDSQSVVKS